MTAERHPLISDHEYRFRRPTSLKTREDPQTQHVCHPRRDSANNFSLDEDDEEVAARCFNSIKMRFCVSIHQLALHSNDIAQYESGDWIVMAARMMLMGWHGMI